MAELKAGHIVWAGSKLLIFVHQAVAPAQFLGQLQQHVGLFALPGLGHHLRGKKFTLNVGYRQQLLLAGVQPVDTLVNHRFHPHRQATPIQSPALDPLSRLVLHQAAALLHVTQQLDGKQGMPFGMPE